MFIYILLLTSQPPHQNLETLYEAMFYNTNTEWYRLINYLLS